MDDAMAATSEIITIVPGGATKNGLWPALPVPAHIMMRARLHIQSAPTQSKCGTVHWIGIFRGKGLVGLEMVCIVSIYLMK